MIEKFTYETYRNITERVQLGLLADEMITCITNAFGQEMPESEINHALRGTFIIVARTQNEAVVGFSTLHRRSVKEFEEHHQPQMVGYDSETVGFSLGAGVVDKQYQHHGIYRELNRYRLRQVIEEKSPFICTTTQNPRVEKGITAVLEEFSQSGLITAYTINRLFLPGFFKRRLTNYPIKTDNTSFSRLNIEAGDAFSLLFKLTLAASNLTNW